MIKIKFLITILIISLFCVGCSKKQTPEPAAERGKQNLAAQNNSKTITKKPILVKKELDPDIYGKRDPFTPVGLNPISSTAREVKELYLEGIITDPVQPLAIINNTILKVGDVINGKKVIKIESKRVILKDQNDEEYIIHLF